MRTVFQILLLTLPLATMGQSKFEGTYLFPIKQSFVTRILTIEDNGAFKYFYYDCQFMKIGQGRVEVTKDSLILNFERIPGTEYQKIHTEIGKGDSVLISVKAAYKEDSSAVTNGYIVLKKLNKGAAFNSDGLAEFKTIKPKTRDTLEINQIGFIPIQIGIDPNHSKIDATILLSNTFYFDDGDTIRYKIDKRKGIQIYSGDYYYAKISRAKARHILKDWERDGVKPVL